MVLSNDERKVLKNEFIKIKEIADYLQNEFPFVKAESILPIASVIYSKVAKNTA